jgi:hypothetical protein
MISDVFFVWLLQITGNDCDLYWHHRSMSNITAIAETASDYDHQGAALYIAVILIWYSTGLAMMLFLQVRPRTFQQQFLFESSGSSPKKRLQSLSANPFTSYRNIQADNTTKQILNELKDPERRQRLWKIYYASAEKHDQPYPKYYQTITSDSATINRIKRKLADIHRMDVANDDSALLSPATAVTTENRPTTSTFDSTKFFSKRFPSLRRPISAIGSTARPQFIRTQSQNDTPSSSATVEMVSLVPGKSSADSAGNGSRRPNSNGLPDRFTIEKVPENDSVSPAGND